MKQINKKPVLIWGISLILILSFVLSGFNPAPSTAKAALPPITIQINESP